MHDFIQRTILCLSTNSTTAFRAFVLTCSIFLNFPLTADDDNKLFAPLLSEIKEGQWLGVTVSSQRPSGVVSFRFPYQFFYLY